MQPTCTEQTPVPHAIVVLERLHAHAVQAAQEARERSRAITREVIEARGVEYFQLRWEGAEDCQEKLTKAFVDAVVPLARRHFATPGCMPEITERT